MLAEDGVEVVGRTTPGPDALAVLAEQQPDILITEIATHGTGMSGPEYIREARACSPDAKIFVLAAETDAPIVRAVLLSGANAYVLKTARPEDLLAAVHQTLDGSVLMLPGELLDDLRVAYEDGGARDTVLEALTKREAEILRLVSEGLTNAELARTLSLSGQTVKFHLSNLYRKIGVANRTEASRWAQRHGILEPEDRRSDERATISRAGPR